MDKNYIDSIAREIRAVFEHYPAYLMSWGVLQITATSFREMAGVRFTVNGFLHKGEVVVAYNEGCDLYEVYCLDQKSNVVSSCEEVYFDLLVETIDSMVEKNCSDEAYGKQISKWIASNENCFI